MNITDSLVSRYAVCPRQAWLEAHGVLQFSEEKGTEGAALDEEEIYKVRQKLTEVEAVISQDRPPKPRWVACCNHCSCCESCYA